MTEGVSIPSPAAKFRDHGCKENGNSHDSSNKLKHKGGLLKDSLELVKTQSNNGRSRYTIKPLEEKLSFDKGFYVFIRAVQLLLGHNPKGIVVVGLAGPSGSGKSVFSEKVGSFLPGAAIISMDMYNDASRLIDSNFDDPRLTDYDLLLENLRDLRDGKATKIPIYSFKESKRVGYREQEVPKSRVVILEGIYALSQRIRPLLDLRVSITGGVHFDLVKRVLRDISRSGQAPEEIIQQISDTVYPMYKAYIEPDLKTAHLRIYNTFNPFSGFMNATYILKSNKPVSKEAIKACLKADHIYKRESEMYDIYLLPPGEDPETCQSWLRMRNRDGRYDLRFEEWVTEGDFVISPRISFEVNVRILGGLMALGYEIGTIMKRTSTSYSDDKVTIKLDDIEGMDNTFVQVQGKERNLVARIGKQLGLEGTYIPRSYIEQSKAIESNRIFDIRPYSPLQSAPPSSGEIQLEKLTASFQSVPEDLRQHFSVDGEPMLDDSPLGKSPVLRPAFRRTTGFALPERPSLASSAPVAVVKMARTGSNASQINGLISHQMRHTSEGGSRVASEGGPPSNNSSGSRNSSGDLDFAFEDVAHGRGHNLPNGQTAKGDRPVSSAQLGRLERLVKGVAERVERLSERPHELASKIDIQVQALTAQQQALNQQVQALATAVESLQGPPLGYSAALPQWQTWAPAVGAGAVIALFAALRRGW